MVSLTVNPNSYVIIGDKIYNEGDVITVAAYHSDLLVNSGVAA